MGVLGFIKRWSKEFNDPYITKTLYTSLVRPILEYGSCVWSPQYGVHQDHIESVQKNFLTFALRGLNWDANLYLPSYHSRLLLINFPSLTNRRTMLGVMFLYNLIYGNIDSQHLLTRLNFNIPSRRTRNFRPLLLSHCSSTYAQHDPFRVLCSDYNGLYHILSLCSTNNLKSLILNALSVQHS